MTEPLSAWQKLKGAFFERIDRNTKEPWQKTYLWNKYMRMTPERAQEIMRRDLPPETQVRIEVYNNGRGKIHLRGGGIMEKRLFDLGKRAIFPGHIHLNENAAAQGYGRAVIRNEIELFRECRAREFSIGAGSAAGGYVWARFGFLPTRDALPGLSCGLKANAENLHDILTPRERDEVCVLSDVRKAENIWQIADLRQDLGPRLRDVFAKAQNGDRASLAVCDRLKDIPAINNQMALILSGDAPFPLGRALLAGSNWSGYFELDNPKQIERARNNVSGWRDRARTP